MRILFFIFLAFTFSAAAQTPAMKKSFDEGVETARRGEFEQASKTFRRILLLAEAEKPANELLARIHFNLGVCLYRLRQTEKAVSELTEAIELNRNYQKAFYALGMAQNDLKNSAAAENAFRAALKLNRSDGEAWFDLGLICLQKREFDAAENAFENSVKFKTLSASDAFNNLGVIAALRHEFDRAEEYFETALKMPENKSKTAQNNLQFCRFYGQKNRAEDLIAQLKFSN